MRLRGAVLAVVCLGVIFCLWFVFVLSRRGQVVEAAALEGAKIGAHYVAGEIGHVPAPGAENEMCTCGRRGHLEAIAAGPQIHRRYLAAGGDPEVANAFEVEQRADSGDPIASLVYRDSAIALGKVLAGVVAVLDPERVVLSGGLARAGELWWAPLRETFRAELIDPLADVPLVRAELGTNAPIIGAARGALRLLGATA